MVMPKKLILDVDNALWGKVAEFKTRSGLKNYNLAVEKLLKKALRGG